MNPLPHPLPLRTDGATLGLRRLVVPTSVGEVVVHAGRERSLGETRGPATILLHGAAGSWTTWTPLVAASDLSPAPLTDVIAIDLPGWGHSVDGDRVRTVGDVSDAVAQVARALGYSSWRVVGHSLGGFIALDVAARHRDATLGVTLVSATGTGVIDAVRRPLRGGIALPWFAGMLLALRILAAFGQAGTALVRVLDRLGWLPALSSPLFSGPVHPSVIAALAGEVRPGAFARAARLAAEYEVRTWTGIACPVRSVRGVRDVFAGETDAAALVALVPDFAEVRLRDAGHFAHIERPDAVLEAIGATARIRLGVTGRRRAIPR
ncbi:alpha/beta hydrolase [uncultured Microbacterium sp.]|uniref:alpha/beta fold hydrolase n=1 Tax=uncultured Microbacterium sp. TaxID=191216 RepID=UPI0028D4EAF2|nr:alpha/beta hydrolase [uncultured Microbacterium sp.]